MEKKYFYLGIIFLGIASILPLLFTAGCARSELPEQEEVESRIREILSLPTFEHVYRDVVYVGEETRFLGILTKDKKALFSIDVVVQAGIDLSEGLDVQFLDSDSAVVTLPRATILSIDADENTIHQYFVRERGGSLSTLQYYDEINRKKVLLEEDAIARGILYKAETNAVQLLRNFFDLAGYDDVEFRGLQREAAPAETQEDTEESTGG